MSGRCSTENDEDDNTQALANRSQQEMGGNMQLMQAETNSGCSVTFAKWKLFILCNVINDMCLTFL